MACIAQIQYGAQKFEFVFTLHASYKGTTFLDGHQPLGACCAIRCSRAQGAPQGLFSFALFGCAMRGSMSGRTGGVCGGKVHTFRIPGRPEWLMSKMVHIAVND
jgi:hypothetical protein